MPRPVVEIRRRSVRSGVEIQGISRSDRGTKYISDSVVIETAGKSKEEIENAVAAGVARILEPQ